MKVTVAGSGMAVPDWERVCSGYYVETNGLKLLLDCGPGVVHHLARFDLDWQNLTHLCITHFHNDHIGDIATLFFAWKWGMLPARSAPLTILGPRGMKKKLKQLAEAFGDHVGEPGFEVEVMELEPGEKHLLGDVVHFSTGAPAHTPEALAFRIEAPGASLGYTGDTGPSDELGGFFAGVETLIMECSLPDALAMPTHLTPTSAARMANLAQPKRLVLTHCYPQLDRTALPGLIEQAGWTGETFVASDGLPISLDS